MAASRYEDVHKVSSGLSDLLVEVIGPERGLGGRATIGVMALANGVCFETWATVEVEAQGPAPGHHRSSRITLRMRSPRA